MASQDRTDRYEVLAHDGVRARFLRGDGAVAVAEFRVPSMHCPICARTLDGLRNQHPAIASTEADLGRRRLTVRFDETQLALPDLARLLDGAGHPPDLSLDHLRGGGSIDADARRMRRRIVVAGLCFVGIMLLSLPQMLGWEWGRLFQKLSAALRLALALPVLVYSAAPYWQGAWRGLRDRRLSIDVPIVLGMVAIMGQSAHGMFAGGGEGYLDCLASLVFLLLTGKWFQRKTVDALAFDRDYAAYFPLATSRLTGADEEVVPVDALRPGDRIRVRHGELVPADAVLESEAADLDLGFVTGESLPVRFARGHEVGAGGRVQGGAAEFRVLREVNRSRLVSLWDSEAFRKPGGRVEALTDRVARWFTPVVVALAALAAGAWLWIDPGEAAFVFVAVLIVACPCALALAAPFGFGTLMRLFGRRGMYLRNGQVAETMAGVRSLVMDKTGTLTRLDAETVRFVGEPLSAREELGFRSLAAQSTHPLSRRIAGKPDGVLPVDGFEERSGEGVSGRVDGRTLRLGSAAWCGAPDSAGSGVQAAVDGEWRGTYRLEQSLRDGLDRFAEGARDYDLTLLSGDVERGREELAALFGERLRFRYRQDPHDKLRVVGELRENGGPVMMMGDGLNDAGALRAADVGVAVTDDLFSFTPACDAILDAASLPALPAMLAASRRTLRVVKCCLGLSIAYNLVGFGFAAAGALSPLVAAVLMPVSSATVMLVSVLGTRWWAGRPLAVR